MGFERITAPDIAVNNIAGLENKPQLTAAQLKAIFDKSGGDLLEYIGAMVEEINGLLAALEDDGEITGTAAAVNLGAEKVWSEDDSYPNIQAKLAALKSYMDGLVISAGAGDMLKSVYDANNNGKIDIAENAEKLGGALPGTYGKEITGQTAKTSLADNDAFPVADSADGNAQKKTFWSTVKSAMQAALLNVFAAKTHGHAIADLTGVAATSHTHNYFQLSGVAASSHSHEVTDLWGVAKSAAGVQITVSNSAPSNPETNDLWFADET